MKIRGKQDDDIAVDMSPMIDMVFLLLIFFLVASQIVKVDKVPIEVPAAGYAKVPEDETGRFTITINQENQLFAGPTSIQMDIDGLAQKLTDEIDANSDLKVVVRADKTVKYEIIEKVMTDACAKAGVNDMIFAAFEK